MKKTIWIRAIAVVIAVAMLAGMLSLVACKPQDTQGKEALTDMVGRELNVNPGEYKRAVCIGAGALRLYAYVCGANNLVGVEDIDNESLETRPVNFDRVARPYVLAYGDAYKTLPSCGVGGPQAQAAEAEKILSCNPDIIVSEYEDVDKANALQQQVGVPVVVVKYGNKGIFDGNVQASLTLLGKIFGKEQRAGELNAYIAQQKSEIERITGSIDAATDKVYLCGLGNWGTTNHLMTAQNYEPFNVAHITNVISGLAKDGIQAIEAEKLAAIGDEIDIIIIDAAAVKNIKPLYQQDPTMFDGIKAWREGKVYLQLAYNAYYTNLEIALINTWYAAKIVYPDAFATLDINAKIKEVTEKFLGKDLTQAILACPMSFGGYQQIDTATFFN